MQDWSPTVLAGTVELKLGVLQRCTASATVYCSVVRSGQSVTMDFREDSSASAASFSPCGSLALDLSADGHAVRRSTIPGCPADELEVLVLHQKARTLRVGAWNDARMLSPAITCVRACACACV